MYFNLGNTMFRPTYAKSLITMKRRFNKKMVIRTLGVLLIIEAVFMSIPMIVSWWLGEADFKAFCISVSITLLTGLAAMFIGRNVERRVSEREGYLIVALVWIIFSLFGMLPYYLSGAISRFTDCYFETMSGFSTTGFSVINNVEAQPHGILLWRALTQWIGGMGVIVLCVAILPMFGLNGMQLYAAEAPGITYEKLFPRISSTAKLLWGMYIAITAAEILLLWLFGMDIFDAVCHSFSTIATGGFSTQNAGIAAYPPIIQYTIALFMLLAGTNFTLLIVCFMGKPSRLLHDEETRWYIGAIGVVTVVITLGLIICNRLSAFADIEEAFRNSFFMVVSAITSTGFAITDYMSWHNVLWLLLFCLMFAGGCSGGTAGGFKWVRLVILFKNGINEIKRRIHPNAFFPIELNGTPVSSEITGTVMAFMGLYIMVIVVASQILCACGMSLTDAFGTAVSAIGNIGINIGSFGGSGVYDILPAVAKWVVIFVMLIGRLEIFTVLILFAPAIWRR